MPFHIDEKHVISTYPYTYEASSANDDDYLREEQCNCTLDNFDDNDF